MLALALALILSAPEVPPVIGPMVPSHRLTTAPALPHPELYSGPPGMCQPTSDRPWWWLPMSPTPMGVLLYDAPTKHERALVETAIDGCAWTNRAVADPFLVLALIRTSEAAGAPSLMLAAAWCREASMRTVSPRTGKGIKGDWHDGVAQSIGPFQMGGWWVPWCGWGYDRRDDFMAAANCYLARIVSQLPRTAQCGEASKWRVAEALAANAPRYIPMGCRAASRHWETLTGWE